MNNKQKIFATNFKHAFSANLISILVSVISIILIPKLIGVTEYGYWQLYLFYASYVGFFHFGLADGVYLKYGGCPYEELNKPLLTSQFWILTAFEVMFSISIGIYALFMFPEENKSFVIFMVALNLLLALPKTLLSFILQSSNRIREYARITAMEKISYAVLIGIMLTVGFCNYRVLIEIDLIAKIMALMIAILYCKDIVIGEPVSLKIGLLEAFDNICVGIKLMFANIASMLIIGIVRFGIEQKWDIETFGKISLTLSISNMLMVFINTIGIVLYPLLRNTPVERLPIMYVKMRNLLMFPLGMMLIGYYPAKCIFTLLLPQYSDALPYMALLFPICLFESKMAMLINTYFKTLRKEKMMMIINWTTVVLSLIISFVSIFMLEHLTWTVLSITILLAFKCVLSEIMLSRIINIRIFKDIFLELALTVIFMVSAWFLGNLYGLLAYCLAYGVYLIIKKIEVKETFELALATLRPRIERPNNK